jgi:hypothetical protein
MYPGDSIVAVQALRDEHTRLKGIVNQVIATCEHFASYDRDTLLAMIADVANIVTAEKKRG